MQVMYKRDVLAPSRRPTEPYERGRPEIDPKHGRVFVGSSDGGLYALRTEDGFVLYRYETLGFVNCAPLYDPGENVVYFGSNDGALYKIDADRGHLLWRFMTNAEVSRRPVLDNGTLYVANANDTVIALEARSGKVLWSQHRTPAMGMEVAGYSGPSVWRNRVYAGFSDGTVTAFDARSGAERWQPVDLAAEAEQTLGEVPQYLDVDTTPVPADTKAGPVVFVASYLGGVFALDADTGRQVWANTEVVGANDLVLWSEPARPAPDGGPPEPERRLLLAATGTTGLWALDPDSGEERWRRGIPGGGVSAPVAVLGALMISTTELGVFLLSPLDGSLIDGIHLADGTSAEPAVFKNRAFLLSDSGRFYGLHITPPIGPGAPPRPPPPF